MAWENITSVGECQLGIFDAEDNRFLNPGEYAGLGLSIEFLDGLVIFEQPDGSQRYQPVVLPQFDVNGIPARIVGAYTEQAPFGYTVNGSAILRNDGGEQDTVFFSNTLNDQWIPEVLPYTQYANWNAAGLSILESAA